MYLVELNDLTKGVNVQEHSLRARFIVSMAVLLMWITAMPQATLAARGKAETLERQPNVLAIWGDDIGWFNLSIHNFGIMGYQTPNLDRIGKEGVVFTDAYAEQSCTAGRAAFLTGQHGLRSGMLKVGLPGVPFGMSEKDPTIATMLKEFGYTTGQFGKNHLGDTNPYLPTNRGFDEFFGNLYHLNAEGEPEHPDYPGDMVIGDSTFQEIFGPRGIIHSFAEGVTAPAGTVGELVVDDTGPYGPREGQTIYDTGPLTRHRMKTVDGAFAKEAIRFMNEANNKNQPFFTWYAASRMHVWTYLKEKDFYELNPAGKENQIPEVDYACHDLVLTHGGLTDGGGSLGKGDTRQVCNLSFGPDAPGTINDYYADGKTGLGTHPDGMVEHDMYAGQLLDFLDNTFDINGDPLAENTIVMYTSDNGPETFSWPDGGTTPFRSEKATNWEGGYRVPLLVRWPGIIDPGSVSNDIIALQDWYPTLASIASSPTGRVDVKTELKSDGGYELDGETYRVHLDGYDFLDYLDCLPNCDPQSTPAPRQEFIYANDDGVLVAARINDWKIVFFEQREHAFNVWQEPFTQLRVPKIFNLRSDPFEKADHDATQYDIWRFDHIFLLTPAQAAVYKFLGTFNDFPPRQVPPSFSVNIDAHDIADQCGTADMPSAEGCFQLPSAEESHHLPATGSL